MAVVLTADARVTTYLIRNENNLMRFLILQILAAVAISRLVSQNQLSAGLGSSIIDAEANGIPLPYLPEMRVPREFTLVLDMDETLIHTNSDEGRT